jgi:hypothetical protein
MPTLHDRLARDPQGWRPQPGDSLVGTLIDVEERESDYGGVYPMLIIETDDGDEVAVHCFHTVLKNEVARQKPASGDRIGIRYKGRVGDAKYESYRVVVEKANGETVAPDWDRMVADTDAELDGLTEDDL